MINIDSLGGYRSWKILPICRIVSTKAGFFYIKTPSVIMERDSVDEKAPEPGSGPTLLEGLVEKFLVEKLE